MTEDLYVLVADTVLLNILFTIWTYLLPSECCTSDNWMSAVQEPLHYIALFSQFESQKLAEKGPFLPTGRLSCCLWRLQTSASQWSAIGMGGKAQVGPRGRKPEIQSRASVPRLCHALTWWAILQWTGAAAIRKAWARLPHHRNTPQRGWNPATEVSVSCITPLVTTVRKKEFWDSSGDWNMELLKEYLCCQLFQRSLMATAYRYEPYATCVCLWSAHTCLLTEVPCVCRGAQCNSAHVLLWN